MYFLSIHTPAPGAAGPPTPEHMQAMGKLMEEATREGWLVTTGALGRRDVGGVTVTLKNGVYTVDEKPTTQWMLGGGFAIVSAASKAEVVERTKEFMAVAGDGVSEVMQLAFGPSHLEQNQ